jgi:cold shock CspA family protein
MRTEGTLKQWNDDRRFGFIVTTATRQDVFVHISALPHSGRRPQPGERLAFSIETGQDGKKRAASVTYLDPPAASSLSTTASAAHTATSTRRSPATPRSPHRHRDTRGRNHSAGGRSRSSLGTVALLLVFAIGAAAVGIEAIRDLLSPSTLPTTTDSATLLPPTIESPTSSLSSAGAFQCDGRTHCSQMTSCTEAKYFLNHCPGVQMDGNNDGEPCEQQWCH